MSEHRILQDLLAAFGSSGPGRVAVVASANGAVLGDSNLVQFIVPTWGNSNNVIILPNPQPQMIVVIAGAATGGKLRPKSSTTTINEETELTVDENQMVIAICESATSWKVLTIADDGTLGGTAEDPVNIGTLLRFTSAPGSWEAHYWNANETLSADGHYVEYIVTDLTQNWGAGVSTTSDGTLVNSYVFWLGTGQFYILLNGGVYASYAVTVNLFDRFRFRKSGSNVIVSRNGVDFQTINLSGTLYAYAASYNGSGSVNVDSVNGEAVTTKSSAACTITLGVPCTDYFADDPNLRFTALNTIGTDPVETAQPCAGFSFKFTGGAASIIFDARGQVALDQSLRTWFAYRIDGGAWTRSKITDESLVSLQIATGLSSGTHEAEVQLADATYGTRWGSDGFRYSSVLFHGVRLPAGKVLSASDASSRLLLMFADSNGQGAENQYPNNNAQSAFPALIAAGIESDLSLVSYPGQGWLSNAGSNVPTFQDSWDLQVNNASRLTGGMLVPEPNVIAICHGQNDGVNITTAATSTINEILAATTTAKVVVMCPVGRSRRSELIAAVAAVNNARCVFFDNPTDWLALYGANGATTHLTDAGHVQYANVMIPQFAALLG